MDKRLLTSAAAIAVLALCACSDGDSEKKSRGFRYMPEMYDTLAFKSQQSYDVVEGGTIHHQTPAMLSPPVGAVSRDFAPYDIAPTDFASAKSLINPLAPTAAVLKRGQQVFRTFCATCHGLDGNSANGLVAPTKERPDRFTGVPSLNGTNVPALSDGEIYHIISVGRNRMANLRAQLLSNDRWSVILYVRALDRATLALSDAEVRLAKLVSEMAEGGPHAVDPFAKAELETARAIATQRKKDLDLIKHAGDGSEFEPPPKPVPEYVTPVYPEK
jgi:mono/diheme cytochrome c family protein